MKQLGFSKSEHWGALAQKIYLLIENFVKGEKERESCRIAQQEKEADEKEKKMFVSLIATRPKLRVFHSGGPRNLTQFLTQLRPRMIKAPHPIHPVTDQLFTVAK